MVRTRVVSVGRRSIRFENRIFKLPERELLCTGHTIHAFIDKEDRSLPIPADLRRRLTWG